MTQAKIETKKLYLGNDHAGTQLKTQILAFFKKSYPEIECIDLGTGTQDSVHYPTYARLVAEKVRENKARGILICGSGIGVSIAANRISGIRAANVWNEESTRLSRQHNDANILCLGARFLSPEEACRLIQIFLETPCEGGRHSLRAKMIDDPKEIS